MRARGEADPPARCRTALGSPVLSVLVLLVLAARRPERRAGDMIGKETSFAELIYGSVSGMMFGLVSPIAGQPFDVVKTKMQAGVMREKDILAMCDSDGNIPGHYPSSSDEEASINAPIAVSNRSDRIALCELLRENLDQIGIVCKTLPGIEDSSAH